MGELSSSKKDSNALPPHLRFTPAGYNHRHTFREAELHRRIMLLIACRRVEKDLETHSEQL